jgi:hypothetical protein
VNGEAQRLFVPCKLSRLGEFVVASPPTQSAIVLKGGQTGE